MFTPIYIERIKYFIPSANELTPNVSFVPMLMRRRLSNLAKLVVYVNRAMFSNATNCKVTFASQFGEVTLQKKISQEVVNTKTISPAHFSVSVFNAAIANASILQNNMAGYSATYSGEKAFRVGLLDCIAALKVERFLERVFIFADETIPEYYANVAGVTYPNKSIALALRLTKNKSEQNIVELDYSKLEGDFETAADECLAFINQRLMNVT